MQKANREHWKQDRDKAISIASAQIQRKAAQAISDNAAIAQRIREKLLRKLEKEIDALPDSMGSETRNSVVEKSSERGTRKHKEATKAYRLRDLTAAYKDLTDDMNMNSNNEQVRIIIDV